MNGLSSITQKMVFPTRSASALVRQRQARLAPAASQPCPFAARSPSTARAWASTSSTSSQQQQEPRPKGPPSKHKLFYRELLPPIVRVLAYSSAAYFALHLLWTTLDTREQNQFRLGEIRSLEEEASNAAEMAKNKAAQVGQAAQQKAKSWWSR